jgi:hypothetical protein
MVETASLLNWLADGAMCGVEGQTDRLLSNLPLAYVTVFCVFFTYASMRCNLGCLVPLWLLSAKEFYFGYLENPSVEFAVISAILPRGSVPSPRAISRFTNTRQLSHPIKSKVIIWRGVVERAYLVGVVKVNEASSNDDFRND